MRSIRTAVPLLLGFAVGILPGSAGAQVNTVTCQPSSSITAPAPRVVAAQGTTTCSAAVDMSQEIEINLDVPLVEVGSVQVGPLSTALARDTASCDACTTLGVATSYGNAIPGLRYESEYVVVIRAPAGTRVTGGPGCFGLGPFTPGQMICGQERTVTAR